MDLKEFKKELLKDSKFAKEYFKDDSAFDIANIIIEMRISKGMTQDQLAKKVGTKQSGIARLERGETLPSLTLLEKVAKALGEKLYVGFKSNERLLVVRSNVISDDLPVYRPEFKALTISNN